MINLERHKPNNDIRLKMSLLGISARELSEEIGISTMQFYKWLDKELSNGTDKRIMNALHNLEVKKQNEQA